MSLHRAKHMPVVLLVLALVAFPGCGGGGGGNEPADTSTDTEEEDTGIDQGDVTPETTPDATDTEEEDVAGDVEEEDTGGHGGVPFVSEGAGGAFLTSTHFRLEVFVAPARPLGAGSSTHYNVTLGPAAVRAD